MEQVASTQVVCGQRGGRAFAVSTSPGVRCKRFTPTVSRHTANTQDQETALCYLTQTPRPELGNTLPIKAGLQALPTPPDETGDQASDPSKAWGERAL